VRTAETVIFEIVFTLQRVYKPKFRPAQDSKVLIPQPICRKCASAYWVQATRPGAPWRGPGGGSAR
jgi:hypothetical protein